MNSELYHHGILGMHWGIRRYQNPDGSLTPAGEQRYLTNKRFRKKVDSINSGAGSDLNRSLYNPDGSLSSKGVQVYLSNKGFRRSVDKKRNREERTRKVSTLESLGGMTDNELENLAKRLGNELKINENLTKLIRTVPKSRGEMVREFVSDLMVTTGKQVARDLANQLGRELVNQIMSDGDNNQSGKSEKKNNQNQNQNQNQTNNSSKKDKNKKDPNQINRNQNNNRSENSKKGKKSSWGFGDQNDTRNAVNANDDGRSSGSSNRTPPTAPAVSTNSGKKTPKPSKTSKFDWVEDLKYGISNAPISSLSDSRYSETISAGLSYVNGFKTNKSSLGNLLTGAPQTKVSTDWSRDGRYTVTLPSSSFKGNTEIRTTIDNGASFVSSMFGGESPTWLYRT